MGFLVTKERLLKPGRSRLLFVLVATCAFGITECGRLLYRPYVYEHGISDFGLADSMGNLGGIIVQIFFGLAIFNSTRRQSYRLAVFFSGGYILYEFLQRYLQKSVFDWLDIYGTLIGFAISVALLKVFWRMAKPGSGSETQDKLNRHPIA